MLLRTTVSLPCLQLVGLTHTSRGRACSLLSTDSHMLMRGITVVATCIATVAFSSAAVAQDTMRVRDTTQMRMRQGAIMSAQVRDSLIARLLDSANRVQDPIIARRLRDSVTTLRSAATAADSMRNRMTTQQSMPMMQQPQPSAMTSDQRIRVRKEGRAYPDSTPSSNPPVPPARR
jgi:hypothetical protein